MLTLTLTFLLLSLQHVIYLVHAMGCEEGKLQLKTSTADEKEYLQICHNEEWGYVCGWRFDDSVDGEVVLQQLSCTTGSTSCKTHNDDADLAYQLHRFPCAGVERTLKECPRYQDIMTQSCNKKVTVDCKRDGTPTRQCMNGELKQNKTNNMLQICVSGAWRPICSYFWGHTQATVACRQLNPGKTVFRAAATYVPFETKNTDILEHPFYCTGQEMNITNCSFDFVPAGDDICNSDFVAGVECGIGSVSAPTELIFTPINSFTMEANWTQLASDSQRYSYLTISCTSIDELYTTMQQALVNISAAENESMHMMISGLMPNISYNCCVSVYTELGRSEEVCDHVTTVPTPEPELVVSTARQVATVTVFTNEQSLSSSASVELKPQGTIGSTSSPLPCVCDGIIQVVLGVMFTVVIVLKVFLAAVVWMIWRHKSKCKIFHNSRDALNQPDGSTDDDNSYNSDTEQSKEDNTHNGKCAESSLGADNSADMPQ